MSKYFELGLADQEICFLILALVAVLFKAVEPFRQFWKVAF